MIFAYIYLIGLTLCSLYTAMSLKEQIYDWMSAMQVVVFSLFSGIFWIPAWMIVLHLVIRFYMNINEKMS